MAGRRRRCLPPLTLAEALYGDHAATRAALAQALGPIRAMLCQDLRVDVPACQFAVMAVGAMPDLPREAWLAATSVLVGLLAGFLWWAGSRSGGRPEESLPAWKASDDDDSDAADDRRLAA